MDRRYRVLLIAEAANPEWVSVPLVGWSIAEAMRSVADVHIVTQVRNKAAFERAGLIEGLDFTAIDTEAWMKPLWAIANKLRGGAGKGWTMVTAIQSLAYPIFERMIWRRFGKEIRARQYDIVHRITPLSPTAPSSLAGRCAKAKVPFVVGPLNGGIPWPREFSRERHQEKEWLSYVRNAYKMMPAIRRTWRNSAAIIAGSHHTASEIPNADRDKLVYIPENAINPDRFNKSEGDEGRYQTLNLCFIGRLVPYKGPDIAIEAAQNLLRSGQASLTIIGDGPMMGDLKALTEQLGVTDAVKFTGWLEHAAVPTIARQQSVFLFPSVREFGGGAVIEAMSLGLVPIVANYGGPSEIVSEETGFRLPIESRELLVASARKVLEDMASGKHDLTAIAREGQRRISDLYTWKQKAIQILEIYNWVAGKRVDRPKFDF